MDSCKTSPSHAGWRANMAHYGWGFLRRKKLWSARGWETHTGWDSEEVFHACNVELSLPQGQWRHTIDACTGRNPEWTGAGRQSVRQSTNLRCTMWAFHDQISDAPDPYLDDWVPPARVMACGHNLTASTCWIRSLFWRNTPTPSSSTSTARAKSQWGE